MAEDIEPYGLLASLGGISSSSPPPVHLWHPEVTKDIDLRIASDGTWYYLGTPIKRRRLIRLFSTVLRRDDDGYCLITPVEKCRIQVEDVPFQAILLTNQGDARQQVISLTTDIGDVISVGSDAPLRCDVQGEDYRIYVYVRDNMEARLNRNTYYQLMELVSTENVAGQAMLGVWSNQSFFSFMAA